MMEEQNLKGEKSVFESLWWKNKWCKCFNNNSSFGKFQIFIFGL